MKPASRFLSLLLVAAAAAACGKDDKAGDGGGGGKDGGKGGAAKEDGGTPKTKYDKSKATGSIKGVVKFKGTPPEQRMQPKNDAFCKGTGDSPLEATEVNADGTVPHVFIHLAKGPHDAMTGFEQKPLVIDQKGCVYEPHVSGVMVGQDFTIKNSDNTTHNVKANATRNDSFNLIQELGKSNTKSFAKKEFVRLNCDVHSWMSAHVICLEHPFYATSSRTGGTFEIGGLPAGKYTVKAWHETWAKETGGKTIGEYEVKDGQATEVTIELGQ